MKKRILVVTDNYPHKEKPHIVTFFHDHAKVLAQLGDVKVITLIRGKNFGFRKYFWEEIPVEAVSMPYVPGKGVIFLPLTLILHTFLLLKNLFTFKPDSVVVHMATPAGIPAALFLRGNFTVVEHSSRFSEGWKKHLTRFVFKYAKKKLVVSSFLLSEMEKIGVKLDGVLPNPIRGCEKLKRNRVTKRVSFVGRITPKKDPILLKEAARLLPEYEFLFIGAKEEEWYFEKFIENMPSNCEYLGPLPRERVLNVVSESDMLVSTSTYETFGVAIAEVLSCGKPVVWTDSGGPRDFLNEKNSVRVDERSPEAVAKAIKEAYAKLRSGYFDPAEIREGILQHASPQAVAELYERFLS